MASSTVEAEVEGGCGCCGAGDNGGCGCCCDCWSDAAAAATGERGLEGPLGCLCERLWLWLWRPWLVAGVALFTFAACSGVSCPDKAAAATDHNQLRAIVSGVREQDMRECVKGCVRVCVVRVYPRARWQSVLSVNQRICHRRFDMASSVRVNICG